MADGFLVPGDLLQRFSHATRRVESAEFGPRDSWSGYPGDFREFPIVRIRNDTNADLGCGEVVALGDLLDPSDLTAAEFSQECLTFAGIVPAAGYEGKFAIVREPIAAGDYGYAAISGAWPAIVNKQDDADTRAEIDPGNTVLIGGTTGSAKILKSESGVGNKWAIVRFDEIGDAAGILVHNAESSSAIPAYGACVPDGSWYSGVLGVTLPLGPADDYVIFLNGDTEIAAGETGYVFLATDEPRQFLMGAAAAAQYSIAGPVAGDAKLYPGLPGFRVVTPGGEEGETPTAVWEPAAIALAIATTDISADSDNECFQITARPCLGFGSSYTVYDGGASATPLVSLKFSLRSPVRYNAVSGTHGVLTERYPNLRTDDIFQWSRRRDRWATGYTDSEYALSIEDDVWDDVPGTVKMWSGSATAVPRGWALCDGTANASGNGGSGIDLRGYFVVGVETRVGGAIPAYSDSAYTVGATGGAKTHVHAGGAAFGGSGTAYAAADHRPPWFAICYIERIH